MRKVFIYFTILAAGLIASTTAQAQVNMSRFITLTVAKDSVIKLNFKAAANDTPVKIKCGSHRTEAKSKPLYCRRQYYDHIRRPLGAPLQQKRRESYRYRPKQQYGTDSFILLLEPDKLPRLNEADQVDEFILLLKPDKFPRLTQQYTVEVYLLCRQPAQLSRRKQ